MKRITSLIVILALLVSFASCADGNSSTSNESSNTSVSTDTSTTTTPTVDDPVELLNKVWEVYKDEERFFPMGGDLDNVNMDGAGKFGLQNSENIDSTLGLPASMIPNVESAASIINAMNANSLTCAAYKLKNEADISTVANAIKENLDDREWQCGVPETLIIFNVDGLLVTAFGNNVSINIFVNNLKSVFSNVTTLSQTSF